MALSEQQFRNEPGQFPGYVNSCTIGDYVEPSIEADLWRDLFYLGSTPLLAARFVRASAPIRPFGKIKPGYPNLFL